MHWLFRKWINWHLKWDCFIWISEDLLLLQVCILRNLEDLCSLNSKLNIAQWFLAKFYSEFCGWPKIPIQRKSPGVWNQINQNMRLFIWIPCVLKPRRIPWLYYNVVSVTKCGWSCDFFIDSGTCYIFLKSSTCSEVSLQL